MSRRFIATILAAAIAVTGISAQSASASDRDLGKFLVGAAALAAIGIAIKNSKDDDERPRTSYRDDKRGHHGDRGHRGHRDDNRVWPRPLPDRVRGKTVAAECRETIPGRHGPIAAFGADCLREHARHTQNLPRACATEIRSGRGRHLRDVYTAQCLRNHGYRVVARR